MSNELGLLIILMQKFKELKAESNVMLLIILYR